MTQPPPSSNLLEYAKSPEGIREIAGRQRAILLCILGEIILYACMFLLPPEVRIFASLAYLAVGITAAVFAFLLCIKLYGTVVGIILGIVTLIPCIGLLVLLVVNQKATSILKANGLKVGLLGAKIPT